jgi:hypothetical protein
MINRDELDKEITESRKHKSVIHREGRCGGMYGLCGDCDSNEYAIMLAHARKEPSLPGEDQTAYTRRIGLPMYDSWYRVATTIINNV